VFGNWGQSFETDLVFGERSPVLEWVDMFQESTSNTAHHPGLATSLPLCARYPDPSRSGTPFWSSQAISSFDPEAPIGLHHLKRSEGMWQD
jgi:hypothetical protein